MQIKFIINKIKIPKDYFDYMSFNITTDLDYYLYDNLQKENSNIISWDLQNALIENIDGEYI